MPKRHLVVNTLGLLAAVMVTAGNFVRPRRGSRCAQASPARYPRRAHIDRGYTGKILAGALTR